MNKTKVFISQPMKDLTEEEILAKRNYAIDYVSRLGFEYEIIDSYFEDYDPEAEGLNAPVAFLAKSIELLAQADLALFIDGWDEARGCKIEQLIASNYGIECVYLNHGHLGR